MLEVFRRTGSWFCTVLLVVALSMAGCEESKSSPTSVMQLAVVDVERVLKESEAANAARQHLGEAQQILRDGWEQLQKKWAKAPQKEREKVLANGLQRLNVQLANEEEAAKQAVLQVMREAVRKWRRDNNAVCVLARQNLLDVAEDNDITGTIIGMMAGIVPAFPDLPTVDVRGPKPVPAPAAKQAAPAGKNAPPKPRAADKTNKTKQGR